MAPIASAARVILASGSRSRRDMLTAAGLSFDVVPAPVDEPWIRDQFMAGKPSWSPPEVAEVLAKAKAEAVSRNSPDALVIGADQVLALGAELLHKAASRDEARATLVKLRGLEHALHAAVVLAHAGEIIWLETRSAKLKMRNFSSDFVDDYLTRAGTRVLDSVGCYQIESLGSQLFERIDGDHFTILGLPLIPLLEELRKREVIIA